MRQMFNTFDLLAPLKQSDNHYYESYKQNLWKGIKNGFKRIRTNGHRHRRI